MKNRGTPAATSSACTDHLIVEVHREAVMINALSNEQILAPNQGEVYFSENPSKFPETGHGTQYHCGAAGLLKFARA
jgi:hypothetical protein